MTENYWSRFHRRRLTRRNLLAAGGTAGIGLAGLAITGCGDDDDDDDAPSSDATADETPEDSDGETPDADETEDEAEATATEAPDDIPTGGTLRSTTDVGFDSLDPHSTVAAGLAVIPRIYNRLMTRAPAQSEQINYDLATAVEQPDDVTYVFSLRDDVIVGPNSFGVPERPLTADDIVASLDRNKADPVLNGHVFVNTETASYGPASANEFEMVSSEVNGFYLDGLAFFHFPPAELLEGNLKQEAVGGGPFLVDSFTEGQGLQLVRNPNYYNQPLPYLDGIGISIIADRAARRTAFVDNQADLYTAENAQEADQLLGQVDGIRNVRELSTATTNIAMQVRQGPFADERVRLAVLRGTDRSQFISILEGEGGGEPDGLVWSAFERYTLPEDELQELQGYDPDEARSLLEAAGLGDGFSANLIYPTTSTQDFAPIFVQQMAAIGIELVQQPLDFATWLSRYQSGDFEILLSPNISYAGPISHLNFHLTDGPSENGNFWTGFADPEVDAAIKAIEAELSVEGQQDLFLEAQRVIYPKGPAYIPIFSAFNNTLIYEYVKGYGLGELPPILYLTEFDYYIDR